MKYKRYTPYVILSEKQGLCVVILIPFVVTFDGDVGYDKVIIESADEKLTLATQDAIRTYLGEFEVVGEL